MGRPANQGDASRRRKGDAALTNTLGKHLGILRKTSRVFFTDRLSLMLALGYGCFRGANSLMYTSAMSSQTTSTLFISSFFFTLATDIVVIVLAALIVRAGVARSASSKSAGRHGSPGDAAGSSGAGGTRPHGAGIKLPVVLPALLLLCVQVLTYANVFDDLPYFWRVGVVGTAYALASTCINLAWSALLVSQGALRCVGSYALGTLLLAFFNTAFGGLGVASRLVVGAALLAVSVTLFELIRRRPARVSVRPGLTARDYLTELGAVASAVVTMVVLECAVSFLNGFFLGHSLFSESGMLFSLGSVLGSVCVLAAALALPRFPSVRRTYRLLFPALAATIALLPFAGDGQNGLLGAALMFFYSLLSQWTLCIVFMHTAKARLDAVVVVAFTSLLGRLGQLVFIPIGYGLGTVASGGTTQIYSGAVLFVVYGLAMLLMYFSRKSGVAATPEAPGGSAHELGKADATSFELRSRQLAEQFRLTKREEEILMLIARGRSAAFIGQELSCSTGTVRSHIKNIYAKLDVHSKQEVIDLFAEAAGDGRGGA